MLNFFNDPLDAALIDWVPQHKCDDVQRSESCLSPAMGHHGTSWDTVAAVKDGESTPDEGNKKQFTVAQQPDAPCMDMYGVYI